MSGLTAELSNKIYENNQPYFVSDNPALARNPKETVQKIIDLARVNSSLQGFKNPLSTAFISLFDRAAQVENNNFWTQFYLHLFGTIASNYPSENAVKAVEKLLLPFVDKKS